MEKFKIKKKKITNIHIISSMSFARIFVIASCNIFKMKSTNKEKRHTRKKKKALVNPADQQQKN